VTINLTVIAGMGIGLGNGDGIKSRKRDWDGRKGDIVYVKIEFYNLEL